jgi:putative phosphoesterase
VRYGLLADVHGNLPALEAVLEALDAEGVERCMCAGDIVGYGPQPDECIDALRERETLCVAGNHELILVGRLPEEGIHEWARTTLRWTRGRLSADNRAWIEGLPLRAGAGAIAMAHGSLDDARTYVRTEEHAREQLAALGAERVLVLGHTHVPLLVPDGGRLLVNPGAVGQSRERRILASAAVLDSDDMSVRFVTVPYDVQATARALAREGLPSGTYRLRPGAARRAWLRLPSGLRRAVKRMLGR